MAKDITIRSFDGNEIMYPKTVSEVVYDNRTGLNINELIGLKKNFIFAVGDELPLEFIPGYVTFDLREYPNDEFSHIKLDVHDIEHLFISHLFSGYELSLCSFADENGELISYKHRGTNGENCRFDKEYIAVPSNAKWLYASVYNGNLRRLKLYAVKELDLKRAVDDIDILGVKKYIEPGDNIKPIEISPNGYYDGAEGDGIVFRPLDFGFYRYYKYDVEGADFVSLSTVISGVLICSYFVTDSNGIIVSKGQHGENSVDLQLRDHVVQISENAKFIYVGLCYKETKCAVCRCSLKLVTEGKMSASVEQLKQDVFGCVADCYKSNGKLIEAEESNNGYYEGKIGGLLTFHPLDFGFYRGYKISIDGRKAISIDTTISGVSICLYFITDEDGYILESGEYGENGTNLIYEGLVIPMPDNASQLYVSLCGKGNLFRATEAEAKIAGEKYVDDKLKEFVVEDFLLNYWKGKKIAWYGTSIPAQGYPQMVGQFLKCNVLNEAQGSSMCRSGIRSNIKGGKTGDEFGISGLSWQNVCYSLTLSQEEKNYIFRNWTREQRKTNLKSEGFTESQLQNVKGYSEILGGDFYGEGTDETQNTGLLPSAKPSDVMSDSYRFFRRFCYGCSWNSSIDIEEGFGAIYGRVEKYLSMENQIDLFVIDHGHNDYYMHDDFLDAHDMFDRFTFIGSVNFLINKILSFNPRQRIMLVSHYEDSSPYSNINSALDTVSDFWNIPLYKCSRSFQMKKDRVITTNAYWDKNKVWHQSGFDGTNGSDIWKNTNIPENPRIENGVWVHDLSLLNCWQADCLHPDTTQTREHIARMLAQYIRCNL